MTLRLGRYDVVLELARGGMGVVSLARARGPAGFDKLAIVKELKPELAAVPALRTMFLDEARLAARLNHRNIVQTHEIGWEGGRYFIAMEYLEGCSLRALQKALPGGRLPALLAVHVAIEALAGLHHAHELVDIDGAPLGVVHRDVTPQNLFLTFDGQVKLLDFGVAKAVDRDQVTHCGELKGCIPYMSPEHARGGPVDRRADLFAVGVVMREALTGERLWARIGDCAILQRLFARDLPPFDDEQIPASLRAVCARAMAPDPDERFATAEEMRAALEAVASTLGGERSLARIGSLVTEHFASERERVRDVLRSHGRTGVSRTDARNAGEDIDTGDATRIERSGISGAVISQCSLPPAAGRSRKWAVRGVVALVAIAGAGAFLGTQRLRAPGVSVASGGSGGAAPQSTLPETRPDTSDAELVDVVIRATPREATIVVDDVVVAHGTWSVRRTRGSDVHRVRVRAPGYAEAGEEFDYGRSSTLNLQLAPTTRAPTPNRGARPAAAASPSAAPAVAIANRPLLPPRDSARASQSLDRQNPYTE